MSPVAAGPELATDPRTSDVGVTSRYMAAGAAVIVISVAAIVGAVVLLALHATDSMAQLQQVTVQSHVLTATAGRVLDVLQKAESTQRAYLVAGQPELLPQYRQSLAELSQAVMELRSLTGDRPWLGADIATLQTAINSKLATMQQGIALMQDHGPSSGPQARLSVATDALGEASMNRVRDALAQIFQHTEQDTNQRGGELAATARACAYGVLATAFAAAAMLGAAALGLLISRNRLLRFQETARLQSERLQSTVNHTRDGVAVFDARDRLLLWNSTFFPATGFPEDLAHVGTPFVAFAEAAVEWSPPFLSGGRPPAQARVTEARRGRHMLEIWRSAMPDGGQMIAVADITRRVEAEAIAGQAQKMEALGQLTGGVAHDFNNLLQVVSANLELIGTRITGDEWLRARLAAALAGVARGARLTRHLLAFARRQALAPQAVDTTLLLTGMEEMLRRTLGNEIDVNLVINGNLWAIRADPQQLENAVLNLAINARDAMPNSGRLMIEGRNALLDETYASAHADVAPGQYVMIAVSDTGNGMTEAEMARAIEPFYTTKPEGRGTGLGLSMVYGFARQSGGHLKLFSEPGHGTTVRIYIPRTTSLPRPVPAAPLEAEPARGETILLVEDDAAVRLGAAHALRGLGYRVSEADTADAALAMINKGERPDILFTDVVMPGTVTARQLAAHARQIHPSMAVVFTSGYTEVSGTDRSRIDPGVILVSKPWKIDDLARRLRAALAEAHAPRPEAPSRLRILLTEDDPLVRMTTADMLADMGHDVRQAASAAQGLELLDGVDLMITDLGLPDMDGRDLAYEARERRPDLRVIIASGQERDADLDETIAWLEKPYDASALRAALQLVQKQSVRAPAN